jgi:hypothetical protein
LLNKPETTPPPFPTTSTTAPTRQQQQHLQKRCLEGRLVGAPEGRDRVVVRMQVRRHQPNPDVAERRPLDPARGEDAVGVAVDQKRQHQARVILRLAARHRLGLEGVQRHPLHRRHDEVRQVVLRQPVPHVRRQQERLVAAERNKRAHRRILHHSPRDVNPTGC